MTKLTPVEYRRFELDCTNLVLHQDTIQGRLSLRKAFLGNINLTDSQRKQLAKVLLKAINGR